MTERPEILVTTDEHEVNAAALAALRADRSIYQRGGWLVRIQRIDELPEADVRRGRGAPVIARIPKSILREKMTAVARWTKLRRVKDDLEEVPTHPPSWAVEAIYDRGSYDGIRTLTGVVEVPMLRPDGSVLDRPGYDQKTGLFYDPAGKPARVPPDPTREDAEAARDELLDVVADFPFATEADRAAWLAALLTPFVRHGGVDTAPMFVIDANTRGSGKSLLVDATGVICSGRRMPRTPAVDDDAEMRKSITACTLAGDRTVLIDNVVRHLGCASLDAALTAATWKERLLGKNENSPELPMRVTWFATGNNVVFAADTSRRSLRIRLESPLEHPEDRTGFRHPRLLEWVTEHRPRLVAAALTILRAYVVADRPDTPSPSWGSFEEWSDLVRAAALWITSVDPKAAQLEVRDQADEDKRALEALVEGLRFIDPLRAGMTAAEILKRVGDNDDHGDLREAIEILAPSRRGGLPSTKALGRALRRNEKRVVGGKYIESRLNRTKTLLWFVEEANVEVQGLRGLQGFSPTSAREKVGDEFGSTGPQNPANPETLQSGSDDRNDFVDDLDDWRWS